MSRPGKWDHIKPQVIRLIHEGVDYSGLRKEFPNVPKGTLHGWYTAYSGFTPQPQPERSEPESERSETPRLRLPIDPESPIEKVRNALWDIVKNPDGKGVAVQALNAILKSFEVEARLIMSSDSDAEESRPVIMVEFD